MITSYNGINFIKQFEGLELKSYRCPANILTIGYGHTGKDVKEGQEITEQEAVDLLKQDLKTFEKEVERLVTVDLTQNQFDALVSFTYNLGSANLTKSTLLKKLNAGDYQGAAHEFLKWNKAGGKELAGLTKRRKAESDLFMV